jgi:3-deoxy-7-phosphoheptulonate synthase
MKNMSMNFLFLIQTFSWQIFNIPKKSAAFALARIALAGQTQNTLMVAGPCSVESEEQIEQTASLLNELNLSCLRAGSFKPRTSPYSFQGMGVEGLKILRRVCDENNFSLFSEVRDATHVDAVIEYADVVQIGAKVDV